MAFFHIYGDDSGKFPNPNDDYTAFCGYVAHTSETNRFSLEWQNHLFRWHVPPLHMREIMHEKGPWLEVKNRWGLEWEVKRDVMLREFAAIIRDANVVCVGAVVDAAHLRSLPESEFRRTFTDSLYLAFHQLVMGGIEATEIIDRHSSISIVVDDDKDSYSKCYEYLQTLKNVIPKVKERVCAICFADDRSYPILQAADMIAYESRRVMLKKKANPAVTLEEINAPLGLFGDLTMYSINQPMLYTPAVLDRLNSRSYDIEKSDDPSVA
jgi:hypothetical protein